MNEDYIALLEKTLKIQSSIMQGHSVKAVLRQETKALKEKSGADIIALCIGGEAYISMEMVLKEKRTFLAQLRKYNLTSKQMFLNRFMRYYNYHHEGAREYLRIDTLHKVFDGTFSQTKSLEFEKDIHFSQAFLFPIRSKRGKKIGFVLYILMQNSQPLLGNMSSVTEMFETLIRPFFDEESGCLHSKCIHVDSKMDILSDKEKEIALRILHGKAYKEIAHELKITINTVKTHTKSIFSKYGVNSKMELQNKIIGGF
ncbi:MAG: helix-turn-helix transcriptional regulator [Sulfurimonas sp.]|nr:helix-turn-helix transcriptional regulator [Sulfurimonas sp.]MDD3060189.1 helix-turn-helix transcriptional regulator [Sulfurimonas sp.]MDD5203217.1 helix-turn-helix transcriptional regulator [Sulfurimonas sp.]